MSKAVFKGATEMIANFRSVQRNLMPEVGRALVEELNATELPEVVNRTPIDTGNLRDTEHVEGPEMRGDSVVAQIVAGGPEAPYATIVHERLEVRHPVGQAKYLESVIDEYSSSLMDRVAARVNLQNTLT